MKKKIYTEQKGKEVRGGIPNLSDINQHDHLAGESDGFYTSDYAKQSENLQLKNIEPTAPAIKDKNQRVCQCGAIIPRDEVLLEKAKLCGDCRRKEAELASELLTVVTTPRRIIKCKNCRRCKLPYAPEKLVDELKICRTCLETARSESLPKQNRIIAGLIENYAAAVRRQIFGGAAR